MESQFYQLCKANGCSGVIETNVKLLSRRAMGIRLRLSKDNVHAQIEVTDEELQYGGEEAFKRIFDEICYRLCEEASLVVKAIGE